MKSEIKWSEVIPSWIQALGIIGLILLVLDRIEIDYKDEAKSVILKKLSSYQSPILEEELFKNLKDKELATIALYELMANKVVLKTASGYEITRHNTRLFDDIEILVEYELKTFSISTEKNEMSLSLLLKNINESLIALESARGNENGKVYIQKIEYYIVLVALKKLGAAYYDSALSLYSKSNESTSKAFISPGLFLIKKTLKNQASGTPKN